MRPSRLRSRNLFDIMAEAKQLLLLWPLPVGKEVILLLEILESLELAILRLWSWLGSAL